MRYQKKRKGDDAERTLLIGSSPANAAASAIAACARWRAGAVW